MQISKHVPSRHRLSVFNTLIQSNTVVHVQIESSDFITEGLQLSYIVELNMDNNIILSVDNYTHFRNEE